MASYDVEARDGEGEEEWAGRLGIPRPSDPVMQKYFQDRDALIAQEDKHRSDRDFVELLSPMASEACAITSQIRFEEQQTVWDQEPPLEGLEDAPGGELYPGMMFALAKDRIQGTKLWRIIRKMPKGALLHCHLCAMVDLDWLHRQGLKTEGVHIFAQGGMPDSRTRSIQFFDFSFSKESAPATMSLWSEDYIPDSPIPITVAADSYPEGGREGFIKWLISRTSISPEESLRHHCGVSAVWRRFTSTFRPLQSLVYYEPVFRAYIRRLCFELVEDGIQWVDIRSDFLYKYRRQDSDAPDDDYIELFRAFGEEVEKFKASDEGKSFWGARIIWTSIRAFDDITIVKDMEKCLAVKLAHPSLVAGYDLVGQEDLGRPLAELAPLLVWFRKKCAEAGVEIPFFFHAGETLSTGGPTDLNLFDSLLLGTRRIGHAFSLYKHPLLMSMVKDRRILIEVCPISEEILRLTSCMPAHPLPAMLAQGVPCAISNDDPANLGQGSAGLSFDFYQTIQSLDNLGLEGLGAMAENSIRWAAFEDMDAKEWTQDIKNGAYGEGMRAKRMKEWKREWERFCQWIVMEFGVDEVTDPNED